MADLTFNILVVLVLDVQNSCIGKKKKEQKITMPDTVIVN